LESEVGSFVSCTHFAHNGEVANVVGGPESDYVLTQTTPTGGTMLAATGWYEGDGAGNALTWSWGNFVLPPNPTTLQEYCAAVEAGDWNRDGHVDLAVLRGFVQPSNTMSSGQPTFHDSELLVAMGPNLPYATFESIALPGAHSWSSRGADGFLHHQDDHVHAAGRCVVRAPEQRLLRR